MAYTFGLDPVVVLDEPDRIRRAVRVAAHHVIARELEKASKRK
ncbi:hypothetical protein [Carbonactinospora thermoautotrophica]|nr:hypothetical protein [Carbonactinospora thermoautotrophica]